MFFSQHFFRDSSTDRPQTLPHDRKPAGFYKLTSKIRVGGAPPKNWGQKTCEISVNFGPLQNLIANISGTRQQVQNRKDVQTREIPPAFDEEKSGAFCSTNGLELRVSLDPLKCTFLGYYILALMGCCALKFLYALEIDQGYLAHTPSDTGVPPKKLIVKIRNLA